MEQCEVAFICRNSEDNAGPALAKCALCRCSPSNLGRNMAHYWVPTAVANRKENPILEKEKRDKKIAARLAKLKAKKNRDPNRRKISRRAQQAERLTERNIIKATKNSGRSNKDGDHVLFESITLDTKLQTTRDNPIIRLDELEKVRQDSSNAGKTAGGLLIRNRNGVGVIVFKEEDIPRLFKRKDEL